MELKGKEIPLILTRTNSEHPDYQILIPKLDAELAKRDGDEHAFYAQYNKSDEIKHVVVAYFGSLPVGCGAFKVYDNNKIEMKRMFVMPNLRGMGIAGMVLKELENWASELGYHEFILETGTAMPEAIHLYEKNGYNRIPNYGQYEGKELSVCFAKDLFLMR